MDLLKNPKIKDFYNRINNIPIEYDLKKYYSILDNINKYDFSDKDLSFLKKRGKNIKEAILSGEKKGIILPELFSIIREITFRILGLRHYDVQMIAAIAMAQNRLIQMNTGEGKTMAAILPALLNAFSKRGVHIFTANDYLAKRDAEWMKPVYDFFDIEVSYIKEGMSNPERKKAYSADITYLTAKEAGFDFLRDQLVLNEEDKVQREFYSCIVDEADFILIDEARVPLVIAGNNEEKELDFTGIAELLDDFREDIEYEVDKDRRNVVLTEKGIKYIEKKLNINNIYSEDNRKTFTAINLSLHAKALLELDKDYIIKDNRIEIIDLFTGRIALNRRWPHGIHKAVENKEKIPINKEGTIFNSITIQHFIKLYPQISGMTATAIQAANEFNSFYDLKITVIPPNKKNIRIDLPDKIFSSKKAKEKALLNRIIEVNKKGQPVLIGTGSVYESENLGRLLKEKGINFNILNAKNHESEAKIIAEAGRPYTITISTNMAGRGVDIHLGGSSEEEYNFTSKLGGLYIIGTNRHESRRIDNQLRGRAGRQGDPGITEFFICMEDDLIKRYQMENIIPDKFWPKNVFEPITNPFLTGEIKRAQRIIESDNFEIRKTLWDYSNISELQRKIFERMRSDILNNKNNPFSISLLNSKKYSILKKTNSIDTIREVEKYISLFYLDQTWSFFLEKVVEIKEGIHLMRYGGVLPLDQFRNRVHDVFIKLTENIKENSSEYYKTLPDNLSDFNPHNNGLNRPSSTWTYLINDNPFSNFGIDLIMNRNMAITSYGGVIFLFMLPLLGLIKIVSDILGKRKK